MPKAPRDKDSATPKKRNRKAAPASGNGVHAENGNGVVKTSVIVTAESVREQQLSPGVEEQIRVRAYEIYLQRGNNGGSPEQDWLRAKAEICGGHTAA